MRKEGLSQLLKLSLRLAGDAEGLTLDEIACEFSVSRRTAERMRDAVREVFPQIEERRDGARTRYRVPNGLATAALLPTAHEMASLRQVCDRLNRENRPHAADLMALERKLLAALKPQAQTRLAPDLDALAGVEWFVARAGPRLDDVGETMGVLRQAFLEGKAVVFRYAAANADAATPRRVAPYGVIWGVWPYLLARPLDKPEPFLFRLDRASGLALADEPASRPAAFSLDAYAARSFGVFQEPPEAVELVFAPTAATDARRWTFHPDQTTETAADGALIVRFTTGGLLELAHHLFCWSDAVRIQSPPRLRESLRAQAQAVIAGMDDPAAD